MAARFTAAGPDAPAVVLPHEIRGGPDKWTSSCRTCTRPASATLAYESREPIDERERVQDALGEVRWLRSRPDVEPRRLALVGASIGASTAVFAMATGARRTVDGRYRSHDLLLVSDEREAMSADGLLDGAVRSEALRSAGPGHGIALLAESDVREALLAWLDERVER